MKEPGSALRNQGLGSCGSGGQEQPPSTRLHVHAQEKAAGAGGKQSLPAHLGNWGRARAEQGSRPSTPALRDPWSGNFFLDISCDTLVLGQHSKPSNGLRQALLLLEPP